MIYYYYSYKNINVFFLNKSRVLQMFTPIYNKYTKCYRV